MTVYKSQPSQVPNMFNWGKDLSHMNRIRHVYIILLNSTIKMFRYNAGAYMTFLPCPSITEFPITSKKILIHNGHASQVSQHHLPILVDGHLVQRPGPIEQVPFRVILLYSNIYTWISVPLSNTPYCQSVEQPQTCASNSREAEKLHTSSDYDTSPLYHLRKAQ